MSIYYQWNDEQNYATLPFTLVVFGASRTTTSEPLGVWGAYEDCTGMVGFVMMHLFKSFRTRFFSVFILGFLHSTLPIKGGSRHSWYCLYVILWLPQSSSLLDAYEQNKMGKIPY